MLKTKLNYIKKSLNLQYNVSSEVNEILLIIKKQDIKLYNKLKNINVYNWFSILDNFEITNTSNEVKHNQNIDVQKDYTHKLKELYSEKLYNQFLGNIKTYNFLTELVDTENENNEDDDDTEVEEVETNEECETKKEQCCSVVGSVEDIYVSDYEISDNESNTSDARSEFSE